MKFDSISLSPQFLLLLFVLAILRRVAPDSVSALCELSVKEKNKVYYYSLVSPLHKFPHGILSEDGYYKVASNGSVLWFQLCGSMIFNHDPPMCVDCKDCGGSSRCGMGCSALASNIIDDEKSQLIIREIRMPHHVQDLHSQIPYWIGYPVCTTLGQPSSTVLDVLDQKSPHMGIIVKMTNSGPKHNCSLSVSVICNSNGIQGPQSMQKVGFCDYNVELKHPFGCAKIIHSHGSGMGWFGTLIVIILCLFGGYILAGAVYRYFFLHIRGIDVIPNLEFWASLPHIIQSWFQSLVRRFRGPSHSYRSSYSPVNF